jgi:hypothetical protein
MKIGSLVGDTIVGRFGLTGPDTGKVLARGAIPHSNSKVNVVVVL